MKFITFSVFSIVCITTCLAQGMRTILVHPAPYPIIRLRSAIVPPGMVSYAQQQQPLIYGDGYNQNFRSVFMPTVLYTGGDVDAGNMDGSGVASVPENMMSVRARSPMHAEESLTGSPGSTQHKPRCLQSILGWYAKKKVGGVLDSFDPSGPSTLPAPPSLPQSQGHGQGLQGGVIYPNTNTQDSMRPGLNQAYQALNDAKNKEAGLNAANAQLNALGNVFGPSGGYPISFREDVEMEEDGKLKESSTQSTESDTPSAPTIISSSISTLP
ncbi:unnamed protein product [Orchesella dallaii]|uniref:Uncharacterized protein n=1 Tax=Orchesella dallaii TaxID=48710 RepID=A0ABP1QU73_9HEXA